LPLNSVRRVISNVEELRHRRIFLKCETIEVCQTNYFEHHSGEEFDKSFRLCKSTSVL